MKFTEFANLLYKHIGNSAAKGDFAKTLFENITTYTDDSPLDSIQAAEYRSYFSGRRSIAKIAQSIMNNLEPSCFSTYIEKTCSDEQVINMAEDFAIYGYTIESMSYDEDITRIFEEIIVEAAAPRKTNDGGLKKYFKNIHQRFYRVKTLLYYNAPMPIYEFYVPNDIFAPRDFMMKNRLNAEKELLSFNKKYVVITGTGGLGKTMLMHHLALTLAMNYSKYSKLPIAVQLKDYDSSVDLMEYIRKKVAVKSLDEYLDSGKCVFLLDGMDEIGTSVLKKFEKELDEVANTYPDNTYILSSRPISDLVALNKFEVFTLAPFTKEQSLKLIDRLVYRPETPELKENFRREVDEKLYETHKEFIENPLLLTIMFMTYERYARIPAKLHTFYKEAFFTLAEKHDSTKIGFDRAYKTGMFPEKFALVLEEFCTRTYFDEKYKITDAEFDVYFNKLKILEHLRLPIRCADLKTDLTLNLCLMYYDSGNYSFIHRSFQEYFVALHLSKTYDEGFRTVGRFFEEHKNRLSVDHTFDMLYDLATAKVQELIFLPYLEKLFDDCKAASLSEQYWNFLERIYPMMEYTDGDVISEYFNLPSSYIYDAILHKMGTPRRYINSVLPYVEEYCTETYLYLEKDGNTEIVYAGEFDEREQAKYDNIEECGHKCCFPVSEVRYQNSNLRWAVEDQYFPYRLEFLDMKRILSDLQKRTRKNTDDYDILF